ncbi:MAG: glycosyl transferase family 2 [uncultured bacterium]|nr:MAG: glycosyl transferase family 2 [uncultured bacterium]
MTISIVIPAYNEEKGIGNTLEAVKKLTRLPDELLVVDGGSTDKTASIAQSYGAKVLSIPHRGIGFARQQGLEAATGDIVAFTDADTLVPFDWTEKIISTLKQPNVSAVYGGYKVTKPSWKGFLYWAFINFGNPILFQITSAFGLHIGGGQNIAFWRKKAVESGGFPVDFKSVEDYEMLRRLKTVGRVIYHPHNFVLSSGRRGEEGIGSIPRTIRGMFLYFTTGKADTFTFPDIRETTTKK